MSEIQNDGKVSHTQDSANTTFPLDNKMDLYQRAIIVAINLLLSFIGTLGNFLIIIAVLKTPQLRLKPSNNLLVSLAVADLIVTMVAQPSFTASIVMQMIHDRCSSSVFLAYFASIAFSGCSSTLHLAAISVDRAISAVKPHQHRDILKKWSKVMLLFCWGTAIAYCGMLIKFPEVQLAAYVSLSLSFSIMTFSYGTIIYKIKCPNIVTTEAFNARERSLEKRISGTIAIVILLYAVCWFPIIAYNLHQQPTMCSNDVKLFWIRSLLLANSSMNFIVYSLRIRQFRAAFIRLMSKSLRGVRQTTRLCFCNEEDSVVVTRVTVYSQPVNST